MLLCGLQHSISLNENPLIKIWNTSQWLEERLHCTSKRVPSALKLSLIISSFVSLAIRCCSSQWNGHQNWLHKPKIDVRTYFCLLYTAANTISPWITKCGKSSGLMKLSDPSRLIRFCLTTWGWPDGRILFLPVTQPHWHRYADVSECIKLPECFSGTFCLVCV